MRDDYVFTIVYELKNKEKGNPYDRATFYAGGPAHMNRDRFYIFRPEILGNNEELLAPFIRTDHSDSYSLNG